MSDLNKCPICGKEGIPNFRKEDVVCPCCNSDLSVYHKIDSIIDTDCPNNKTKKYRVLISVLGIFFIIVIGICVWLFIMMANNSESNRVLALEKEVACLKDSINSLNQIVVQLNKPIDSMEDGIVDNSPVELYIVKRGDSFCKISKNILGSESRYREIINLNNLNVSTVLHEGDTLKLPAK